MPKKRDLIDAMSVRLAIANDRRRNAKWRFHTKRTMTLLLGAALSVGGVTEAFDDTHLVVRKDLDRVSVVKRNGAGEEKVLTSLNDSFTANSVFKLAKAAPDRFVSRESDLFDESLLAAISSAAERRMRSDGATIHDGIALINDEIREEFFKTRLPYGDLIYEKAQKYDVDPALVAAVIEQESRFKPRARSPVGARGLMQLMPRTGRWMGARDLYDPEQNVEAGAKYLKYLEKRFDGNLRKQIAAYNGGEGNVKRYNGVPPFRETRTYVKKVLQNYEKRNKQLRRFTEQYAAEQYRENHAGTMVGASQ